ncbi:MAG: cation transporter, partial [Alphaproteobacteria bacterium PA3]
MGKGHSHGGAIPSAAGRHRKPLYAALALTLTYMTAEIVGGIWTGSLALIADAAHMATDAGGLGLALFAIHFAQKAATPQKTYGYLRTEILAALVNAVVLMKV